MNDFFTLIERRESCRDFDPARPVEREKLDQLLEAARIAPSARNSQPWRFLAVLNAALLEKLRPTTQGQGMNAFVSNAPVLVAVAEEAQDAVAAIGARIKRQDFRSVDIGLATSQLCLAATSLGLSTCILGWFDEDEVKRLLDVPQNRRVRLIIAVGYARTDAHREKKRKPLSEMSCVIE